MHQQRQAIRSVRRGIVHAEEGELLLQHRQRQIDPQRGQQRPQPRPGGEDHPVSLIRAARGAHRHAVAIRHDLDHRLLVMQLRPLGTGPRGERGDAATGGEDAVVLLVDADRPFREGVLRVAAAQLVVVEPLVGHAERVEGAEPPPPWRRRAARRRSCRGCAAAATRPIRLHVAARPRGGRPLVRARHTRERGRRAGSCARGRASCPSRGRRRTAPAGGRDARPAPAARPPRCPSPRRPRRSHPLPVPPPCLLLSPSSRAQR